jgi:colanic acid/amylovoran biosynthesis glycosyltransferase
MSSTVSEAPRVAVFTRHFLPISQTFVYGEVSQMQRYRPSVFCAARENEQLFPLPDVRVGGFGYRSTLLSARFLRAFSREPFALIHAHFGPGGVLALPYALWADLPLVVTFHGYDVPLLRQAGRLFGPARRYAWLSGALLARMSLGLCDSQELKELLVSYGVPARKLRVHRLGVNVERFCPAAQTKAAEAPLDVLMVGRLVEKKGFRYGIEAFARAPSAQRARLTIVGDGPLAPALRRLAEQLGVTARVRFTGVLNHAEVLAQLQQSDVLLAPSVVAENGDRDSGLLVLREAAACGLVPIATLHGGLPDSVDDGRSGFLVPERDVAALAERLERVLADNSLRAALAQAARRKMEREFDQRVVMRALEATYDDARRMHAERCARRLSQKPRAGLRREAGL